MYESELDKTNKNDLCALQRLRSAWASAQSEQSSLSAWRSLGFLTTHWAHSEDWSNWYESLHTCPFVGFIVFWLIWTISWQNIRASVLLAGAWWIMSYFLGLWLLVYPIFFRQLDITTIRLAMLFKGQLKGILVYEILMDCVARKRIQKTTSNYLKWFPRYCDLIFYKLSH